MVSLAILLWLTAFDLVDDVRHQNVGNFEMPSTEAATALTRMGWGEMEVSASTRQIQARRRIPLQLTPSLLLMSIRGYMSYSEVIFVSASTSFRVEQKDNIKYKSHSQLEPVP